MKILIINSKEHWINGWMTSPESLQIVFNTLQKSGCQIKTIEVEKIDELEQVLKKITKDTLVWANAYWVNGVNGKQHAINEQLEKFNVPFLGSNLNTLLKLLEKDTCQQVLKESSIPIPNYLIIDQNNIENANELIHNSELSFPLVIKPVKESRSQGITKVHTIEEANRTIKTIHQNYPGGNIIIEEFLPNNDVTCGFLRLGNEIILLPSYNVVKGMDCVTDIFSEDHYKLPPSYMTQEMVSDKNTLFQLEKYVPLIIDSLEIGATTRVDARLDKNGVLKFFDVNGMPGLNYPASALIKQCFIHFPEYSEDYLFECLINTIVLENLNKYNMVVPLSMETNHLFNLKSKTIIKTTSKNTTRCQNIHVPELMS